MIRQNNKYRVTGGPEGVAWFPSRLGLVGSLSRCVPTLVGNALLWAKSVSPGISSQRVPPDRWDAAIFTAMLGSPHIAWHHPAPGQQPQRPLVQPDGVDLATCVGTEPPRCGIQGHIPGGAEQAASISRHAPLGCLLGSGTQGQRQPRCSQTSPAAPALHDTPPALRCGQAA